MKKLDELMITKQKIAQAKASIELLRKKKSEIEAEIKEILKKDIDFFIEEINDYGEPEKLVADWILKEQDDPGVLRVLLHPYLKGGPIKDRIDADAEYNFITGSIRKLLDNLPEDVKKLLRDIAEKHKVLFDFSIGY